MATDPEREPTIGDVYHLVSLVYTEIKLLRAELKRSRKTRLRLVV